MKKALTLATVMIFMLLAACADDTPASSDENDVDVNETNTEEKGIVAEEDFAKMYSNPKEYAEFKVEFTGQIFVEPERDDTTTYLQVYANPEDYEQNVVVLIEDETIDVKTDDYVSVKGIVAGEFEGENLMGGTIVAPYVEASEIEVVDYVTAVAPTIKEVEVNETIEQHEMEITLEKIEFAEHQTRVYATVTNNTSDTVYFDEYDTKLITGNTQFETEYVYDADLPEIPYDILAGIEAQGVLIYPGIDESVESVTLHAVGRSDDYTLDFDPFVFDVAIN